MESDINYLGQYTPSLNPVVSKFNFRSVNILTRVTRREGKAQYNDLRNRFRGFSITQLCFNSCLLFYSNYPEPDLIHATGCKQPSLRLKKRLSTY
jgi:hypothetical protein